MRERYIEKMLPCRTDPITGQFRTQFFPNTPNDYNPIVKNKRVSLTLPDLHGGKYVEPQFSSFLQKTELAEFATPI
jgi:hypothetical protein